MARASSTISFERRFAWSTILSAFSRASFTITAASPCDCCSSFCPRSAAASPSEIFFWRSSTALVSGGQMNFQENQIRIPNTSI